MMFPPSKARKRIILLIFAIFAAAVILVRYVLVNSTLLNSAAQQQNYRLNPDAPVLVIVFYETLCTDSKHFIIKQLLPTYEKLSPIMDVQLVPYGKAKTYTNPDGTYRFDCQHGPAECDGNIYHACVNEIIEDLQLRLNVVGCMIQNNRQAKDAMYKCGKQYNIDNIDLIQKCFDSSHGRELLKLNGDLTGALRPAVHFIPTITLDGSQNNQAYILKDLTGAVCEVAGDSQQAAKLCKKH